MTIDLQNSIALEGPARTGKTMLLAERAVALFQTVPADSVLVLCSNYYRKARLLEQIQLSLSGAYPQLPVTTYAALVRNTLAIYWPSVEGMIAGKPKIGGDAVIFPELSGFEASEYILKKLLAQHGLRTPEAFADFKGSQRSLIMQLLRRIRLRAENRLTRQDMRDRSAVIGELCLDAVDAVLMDYDMHSSRLRVLDNSKQIDVFHLLFENDPAFRAHFVGRVRHVIVDDVDETVPAQQNFLKSLLPHVETVAMATDPEGGSRRGYLNASPYDWEGLKALVPNLQTQQCQRNDTMAVSADRLLRNWLQPITAAPETLPCERALCWQPIPLTRMAMLDQLVNDIKALLHQDPVPGGPPPLRPGDIAIVMPLVDPLARMQLQQKFQDRGIPLQILTGTQRPTDNPTCRSLLLLLQLINATSWGLPLTPSEFRGLMRAGLKLHLSDPEGVEHLVIAYTEHLKQGNFGLPLAIGLVDGAAATYRTLHQWVENYASRSLEEQIYSAFSQVLQPHLTERDAMTDIHQMLRSLYLADIAKVFYPFGPHAPESTSHAAKEWLLQVKTGIVADTPNKPREIDGESIVLGTPQKVVDFEIERRVQCWIDCASREWARTDNAPLYNAWVHSPHWDGGTEQASDAFNQQLTRTRAGHLTRTLMLYAQERILLYASELDDQGNPQSGPLVPLLRVPVDDSIQAPLVRATLRADQAPILAYTQGAMAVTAVPGAGKTFVTVELLLELIARGTPPERILVLTYMDSAARTLLGRLRRKLPAGAGLPHVSTIHSLALRILTEDDHAVYLGLDADALTPIDEIAKRDLLQAVVNRYDPDGQFFKTIESVLSVLDTVKTLRITPDKLFAMLTERGILGGLPMLFARIYADYAAELHRQGKIDFTDLILYALQLLETHSEIRQKVAERFQYVIEDEAQDSSRLLQQLIAFLSAGHGNLIRTGDTNQSITGTFTSADPTVFRDFITRAEREGTVVAMDHSGRSAPAIIQLANSLTYWASQDGFLSQAFQPLKMRPVEGQNPPLLATPQAIAFETPMQENAWMVQAIKDFQTLEPDASIALLVRSNPEVVQVSRTLQAAGIRAICHTEAPDANPVFLLLVYVLAVLENPMDNVRMRDLLTHLAMLERWTFDTETEPDGVDHYLNLFCQSPWAIAHPRAMQTYFHLQDLMRYAYGQDVCRLVVRVTDLFFHDPQQRSVGYLCALKAQEWVDALHGAGEVDCSPLECVNRELAKCLTRRKMPFRALQEAADQQSQAFKNQFVQVMTLHKSKGQEFDVVFMPGMAEKRFPSRLDAVLWREGNKLEVLLEDLLSADPVGVEARTAHKKQQMIEEEARLVYVGITRAQRALLMSCALEGHDWRGKRQAQEPSRYFTAMQDILDATASPTGGADAQSA